MPPKKKAGKKAEEDWEADLGETAAPTDTNGDAGDEVNGENEEDAAGGGGLMAMLRKKREKRKKKGLPEDPADEEALDNGVAEKAPVEATMDDEFAQPGKKGKGGKAKPAAKDGESGNLDDDDDATGGKILTKAEKEKLKKEREKQRKREQVRFYYIINSVHAAQNLILVTTGCEEEDNWPCDDRARKARTSRRGGAA